MISALALCCEINPNLCLLRLSSTQHNAPEFHATTEIELKARGGPGLPGMPKILMEPCGTPLVPSSHSNRREAYVSRSSGLAKRYFALFTRKKNIYTKDAPSPRQWDYGRHLFSCPLHHHHCRSVPSGKVDPALWLRDPPPACPIRHTPAIIAERAPINYLGLDLDAPNRKTYGTEGVQAATSRPKGL